MMEQLKVAVTPEIFVRLANARASNKDVITVSEASKCQAFVDFYPDSSLVQRQWNGEGLPPVGVTVEAYFHADTNPSWLPFTFKYISGDNIIFQGPLHEGSMSRHSFDCYGFKFRPIRTPEQVAAVDRETAADDIHRIVLSTLGISDKSAARALYDAGYRKTDVQ